MYGFPVIQIRKIRILLNFSRKFRRTIVWLKGTRDQTQFDLAFSRSIKLTLEWREPFECASVCDRLIDVRLLDC